MIPPPRSLSARIPPNHRPSATIIRFTPPQMADPQWLIPKLTTPPSLGASVKTGHLGFEPRLTDSESVVLPLHQCPLMCPHPIASRPRGQGGRRIKARTRVCSESDRKIRSAERSGRREARAVSVATKRTCPARTGRPESFLGSNVRRRLAIRGETTLTGVINRAIELLQNVPNLVKHFIVLCGHDQPPPGPAIGRHPEKME